MGLKASLKTALFCFFSILGNIFRMCPKQCGRMVFSQSRNRCSGNSRAFFEYCVAHKLDASWLYTTTKQIACLDAAARNYCVPRKSWKGLYLSLTCKVAVISHGAGDFGWLWHIVKHRKVVNVWHGTAIKNTGMLDQKLDDKARARIFKRDSQYWDLVPVSSEVFRYYFSANFRVDLSKVIVTGDPKHDNYLKRRHRKLKLMETTKRNDINILYAPTFRDYQTSSSLFFPFTDFDIGRLISFSDQNPRYKWYLRPHPNDKKSILDCEQLIKSIPKRFLDFSTRVCDDLDSELHMFDLVLSDYSSVYIDCLLGDIPCIFIPFDYDIYCRIRGLSYPYHLISSGQKVNSLNDLLQLLGDWQGLNKMNRDHRSFVRNMFLCHSDGLSCQRLHKAIEML